MIITIYSSSSILMKSCISSFYSSRLLINTIWRIYITICISNMSNISIYMNTTIRTIYFTSYLNTILTFFKLNRSIYENTISITFNNTINLYSRIITLYSSLLIKSCLSSLYSSRLLINTIWRIYFTTIITNITNSSIYKNTTTRTFNCTIYINTILTIFKWNTWIYHNTCTIITFNSTINKYSSSITIYSSIYLLNTICRTCITNIRIY